MSDILGIKIDFASLAVQAAMAAATGGASLAVTGVTQIGLAIGDQVIQAAGQQLGLPQSAIDFAQAAFHAAAGDAGGASQNLGDAVSSVAQDFSLNPQQEGEVYRTAEDAIRQIANNFRNAEESGEGESLLVALAKALGKVMDAKLTRMGEIATVELPNADPKKSEYGALTGELQALGQEMSLLSNALANGIKSIGEASTTLARKS